MRSAASHVYLHTETGSNGQLSLTHVTTNIKLYVTAVETKFTPRKLKKFATKLFSRITLILSNADAYKFVKRK